MAPPAGEGEAFNIAWREETSIAELARICWEACGRDPEALELATEPSPKEVDPDRRFASVEKARERAGLGGEGGRAPRAWRRRLSGCERRRWRHERQARPDHGHHGPGRLLPGRAAARQGLRGPRHGPPRLDGEVRAHRAPARPHHAPPGRPARPPLAGRHAARLEARRGLQPRRDVVRRHLLDPADADRRVHRRRRHAAARVHPRGLPRRPLLPGLLERDVRQGRSRRRRPRRRRSIPARPTAWPRSTATTSRSTTASPTTCS